MDLDVTKKGIEKGRCLALALRVYGAFLRDKNLGISALRKDHYWFGNDPEMAKKANVPYLPKVAIDRLSKGQPLLKKVVSILFTLFRELGLQGFPDDYIYNYVRPLSSVIEDFKREVKTEQKSRDRSKKQVVKKAPEKPSVSPLFLREEMTFISKVISPYWKHEKITEKDYLSMIKKSSFDAAYSQISDIYSKRWEVVTTFSTITTQRLAELRNTVPGASNIKKRMVTKDLLVQFLIKRNRPEHQLTQEALKLVRVFNPENQIPSSLEDEPSAIYAEESFRKRREAFLAEERIRSRMGSFGRRREPSPPGRLWSSEAYNRYIGLQDELTDDEEEEIPTHQGEKKTENVSEKDTSKSKENQKEKSKKTNPSESQKPKNSEIKK